MKRVELELVPGLRVEFTDRGRALGQVEQFAERGTRFPVVVFGPEGCGKSALLRQASAMLRELGFEVFYLHPLEREFRAEVAVPDIRREFAQWRRPLAKTPSAEPPGSRLTSSGGCRRRKEKSP